MDGVRNFFDGLANVAEVVMHEVRLHSDDRDDIYHEWFSTLRIRRIKDMKSIENKLTTKIVRQALEDTLRDMLQHNYERTNTLQSAEQRAREVLVGVLREYFTLRIIRLFFWEQTENNSDGFNINRSLFFHCLINAAKTSFTTTINDARSLVYTATLRLQTA